MKKKTFKIVLIIVILFIIERAENHCNTPNKYNSEINNNLK